MRRALTALACVGCLAVTGCGSDGDNGDPIPQNLASDMEAQLDNIRGQIENGTLGACEDVLAQDNTFDALQGLANQVPDAVGQDVRDALAESVDRLGELVQETCDELANDTDTDTTETEPPVETEPEETTPPDTDTNTTPTTPTTPEEEPTDPEQPDDGGTGGTGGGGSGGIPAPEGDE